MIQDGLKLFDDSERVDRKPSPYSESRWRFLNHSARPFAQYTRELLQNWFDDYEASPTKRKNLRKNFHSPKDKEHLSAFFELYLYKLFKHQGFEIDVEPECGQKQPDFMLTSPNGEKILLEATGVYSEREFGKPNKREKKIIDYLNENLDSPDYFLYLNIRSVTNRDPSYSKMRCDIADWLMLLNYEQVMHNANSIKYIAFDGYPSFIWQDDNWIIEFTAIPKYADERGKSSVRPVALWFHGGEIIDTADSVKSSIVRKNAHYGELSIPYIIALNVIDPFMDKYTLSEALFGQISTFLNTETNQTSLFREPNGAWYGPEGYRNQRTSAICIFKELFPVTMHAVEPTIWHHPLADNPLNPDLISLTQQIPNSFKSIYELREGKHPKELVQIDETKFLK